MKAIDLFAGFGGFTAGATMAGARVVWAANHWPFAVQVHALNHPNTEHACQDLRQADWTALPRFDVLLASPACQGHSTASQPCRRLYHDEMRATAWAVVDCADVTEPAAIVVENVMAFTRWRLFPDWLSALRRLGYLVEVNCLNAADSGVPQLRQRIIITASRKPMPLRLRASSRTAFASCIEPNAHGWRPIAQAGAGARARMLARKFDRCLVQHTSGHRGVSLDEPIRTITTKDQWVLVDGDQYRPLTLREYARGMSFADSYVWPDASRADVIRGLGNAVPPLLARDVVLSVMESA